MRKAKYSGKKVICKNSSLIGYSANVAKPGYWVTWSEGEERNTGRVIGRIDRTDNDGEDCAGFLAVMRLSESLTHAGVRWVDPADIVSCYATAPADLLAWITGKDWPKDAAGILRLIAMSQHGTCSNEYIASRDDDDKPYNARPEFNAQYSL